MTTTIHDLLGQLRAASASENELGERFERLMLAYLRTDPIWFSKFSGVWLWSHWPGREGEVDTGIDLVAEHRDGSGVTAVQCKCYAPTTTLDMNDLGTFFVRSGKAPFTERMIIATTNRWTKHLQNATQGQDKPTIKVTVGELETSNVDWSQWDAAANTLGRKPRKSIRPHQRDALTDVLSGFGTSNRGKLIMACGTGKTYTSLRVAEELVGEGGNVLVLLPSISLLSQTLKEWASDATVPLLPFAVCSDAKAGRRRKSEDLSPNDLLLPATTDPEELVAHYARADADQMRVVFSTYQSIPVIAAAQAAGIGPFNLVICDEAHRTTGVTLADEDDSNFTRVHDDAYISAEKRLYMTATPRVYADTSKAKAVAADAVLASMDDETIYGPEFYRIGFRQAVDRDLLSDYKVLILAVDEEAIAAAFQQQLSDENNELKLDDATRIVGCLNALSKRNALGKSFSEIDTVPMQTAVAFSTTIEQSKKFTNLFSEVARRYNDYCDRPFDVGVEHVDGSHNALQREDLITWLKGGAGDGTCRILSNARCLTEGVDVPALSAIIFLEPRNSMIDVIQAVGRVMRKAPGKALGYVILPIGIPAGTPAEVALNDNKRFKVVWQVLNALRSHDDRLNAVVNKLDLNDERPEMVDVQVVGLPPAEDDGVGHAEATLPRQLALHFPVDELRQAIYAQLVKKVGTRHYWEDWADNIAQIAQRHEARIRALIRNPDLGLEGVFGEFVAALRSNLNDSISTDDAINMLSQHLITRPVFEALFADYDFVTSNPVSQSMQAMLDRLDAHAIEKETETLDQFYADVRLRAEGIDNARGKQRIITELYEQFFAKALPKTAEALGIVYTPVEIVDFILKAADDALRRHLDASLSDEGVHVLDPFTGTGTFVVRLLQSGLIRSHDLARKYVLEIHANEILLLAYYIAAINIESTYHQLTTRDGDGPYQMFPGIVYTDTFQLSESGAGSGVLDIFPVNNRRATKQQGLDIRVIVSNPPYSAGQSSANDNAANLAYPNLDRRIAETYAARSTATLKNSLYDSYVRGFRWASDRILGHAAGGVVAFVSNGGYLDGNTAAGIRLTLASEYHHLYVYNLRGNQRTSGEQARKEGGKVFGSGSRATVAILIAVKEPGPVPPEGAALHYRDIGDYLSREEKLELLQSAADAPSPLDAVAWRRIRPNVQGDWIHQRSERFYEFAPIQDPEDPRSIFLLRTNGLKTNRDAWNYNSSRVKLEANGRRMVGFFNAELERFAASRPMGNTKAKTEAAGKFVERDSKKFSWDRSDFARMAKGQALAVDPGKLYVSIYRPFHRQQANVARSLNNTIYQLPKVYPAATDRTLTMWFPPPGSMAPLFSVLTTRSVADNGLYSSSATVGVPLHAFVQREAIADGRLDLFEEDTVGEEQSNISTVALEAYRTLDPSLTAEDLFFHVYGILHAKDYREAFASDLRKSLPRIPQVKTDEEFWAFSRAGRALSDLHVGFEEVAPWRDLEVVYGEDFDPAARDAYRVEKMRYAKTTDPDTGKKVDDKTSVIYNSRITIARIPIRAHDYRLGSRSAIDWVLNQHQVSTDTASSILNDPNDWADEHNAPAYIFDLLRRVVTVSMETLDLVDSLPPLDL